LINVYVYCTVFKVHVQKNWKKKWRKEYFVLGRLEQPSSEQKISCTGKTSPSNHPRTLSICTLWVPIHLSFNSQQGPPLSSFSDVYILILFCHWLLVLCPKLIKFSFTKALPAWSVTVSLYQNGSLIFVMTYDSWRLFLADLALGPVPTNVGWSYSYLCPGHSWLYIMTKQ
jgi:hypothetical protein